MRNSGALDRISFTCRFDLWEVSLRMLRDHGSLKKNHHDIPGTNSRMEALQGAVLSAKLRRLDHWNAARRRHAPIGIGLPGNPATIL